jgi:hypothetical protein
LSGGGRVAPDLPPFPMIFDFFFHSFLTMSIENPGECRGEQLSRDGKW